MTDRLERISDDHLPESCSTGRSQQPAVKRLRSITREVVVRLSGEVEG